jgi:hypothetical protein
MKVYHTLLPTSPVLAFSCLQPRLCLAAANRSHPFLLHQVQAHTVVSEPATRTHSTTLLRPQVFPNSALLLDLAPVLPVRKANVQPELLFRGPSLLSAVCK